MITITEILILLLVSIVLFKLLTRNKYPKNFPPGPSNFPVIGPLLKLGLKPHVSLQKIGKKYNGIFSYNFGSYTAVIIDDHKLLREAFNDIAFCGRPKQRGFQIRQEDVNIPRGIIFNDGPSWQEQRRFAHKTLKDHGLGKKSTETKLQEEVLELLERFKIEAKSGKPYNLKQTFDGPVVNAIWIMVAGVRKPHSDKTLLDILDRMKKDVIMMGVTWLFPWTFEWKDYLPFLGKKIDQVLANVDHVLKFMKKTIQEHKDTYQEGLNRDFTDSYIEELRNTSDPTSSFYGKEGETQFATVIHELYIAGGETTSTMLIWGFLLMALNPETQDKLYEEIKNVVGLSRYPSFEDKAKMPYLEALIMEVIRFSSFIHLGTYHCTLDDINFHGYFIPKNTVVLPNIYAIQHDEKVWGDPENFRPDRFLSPDGKTVVKNDAFVQFSHGKRHCIGENFARDQAFLIYSMTFQQFKLLPDPSKPTPKEIEYISGGVLSPKPFPVVFYER